MSAGHAGSLLLVVLSGAAGGLLPPIAPSVRALLREVLEDPGVRESAYALDSVAQELVWITGPLLPPPSFCLAWQRRSPPSSRSACADASSSRREGHFMDYGCAESATASARRADAEPP
jgi:hypothetical protein